MEAAIYCLAYAAFTSLCLAMERHAREALGAKPTSTRKIALRVAGSVLLCISCALAVAARGWAFGIVEWCGALSVSAICLTFLFPYRPRWILRLAIAAVLVTAPLLLVVRI